VDVIVVILIIPATFFCITTRASNADALLPDGQYVPTIRSGEMPKFILIATILPRVRVPTPDGNPYSHMYWIALDDTVANRTSSNIRLSPLQNTKDKLKHHMSEQHRLGDAKIETGYYQHWKGLLNSVDAKTSNSFWNNPKITFQQKRNVMQDRTGTLENQKLACRNSRTTNTRCQF